MDIIKKKIMGICFIIFLMIIILAIGYFVTGKVPDFLEKKQEGFDIMSQTQPLPSTGVPNGYFLIDASNIMLLPTANTITPLPMGGINNIPNGYYQITITNSDGTTKNYMKQVPYGYIANTNKTDIIPMTQSAVYSSSGNSDSTTDSSGNAYDPTNFNVNYHANTDNYNVQYHDNISDMNKQNGIYDANFGNMYVLDNSGVMVNVPYVPGAGTPTFYQPGSFIFGATSYVPNYEDSVYLSRTSGLSSVGKVYQTSSSYGGFCNQMSVDPIKMEQKCNSLSSDVCASTSCCVLLGGGKCVSGNESGPTMKSNYTDPFLINKDYYYYQGKCYGNC
jgi:hypothetical protein